MTPTRQFLVLTFVVVCASWLLVALHLRDESVVEADDGSPVASAPPPTTGPERMAHLAETREAARQAATLRVVASHHSGGRPSAKWSDVITTLRTREIWRVVAMSLAVFGVAKQWTEVDQLLPPFLERQFGEGGGIFLRTLRGHVGVLAGQSAFYCDACSPRGDAGSSELRLRRRRVHHAAFDAGASCCRLLLPHLRRTPGL